MSNYAIRVENLGKRYVISHQRTTGYKTFRDTLAGLMRRNAQQDEQEDFWAIRDLSFEIKQGDVVGVLGRNGAGKSTLLKLLSRITRPTTGSIRFRGRVSSLLEVGTGFHPELSGRENIFLNGAIMGMSGIDIRRRFDQIVAFAEIEQFLDTPVKRYSSGMYMRLAFAVAAHLEPDVLLVDEVLAVGDLNFQKKCLGKMQHVATKEGRTVLFVSHNMHAIARLCHTAVWLKTGQLAGLGPTAEVVRQYQAANGTGTPCWENLNRSATEETVAFERVWVARSISQPDVVAKPLSPSEPFVLCMRYSLRESIPGLSMAYRVVNSDGIPVFSTCDTDTNTHPLVRKPGVYEGFVPVPADFLAPGTYTVQVAAHVPFKAVHAMVDDCIRFDIDSLGSLTAIDNRAGVVSPRIVWTTTTAVQVSQA